MPAFSMPYRRCKDGESVSVLHAFWDRLCLSLRRRLFPDYTLQAMEDAHAVVLDLDGPREDSNTFFAVYDGHGGAFTIRRYLNHRKPHVIPQDLRLLDLPGRMCTND